MTEKIDTLPQQQHREPRRHRWLSEQRIAASEYPDGNGRTIRTCANCAMKRITVHPPQGYPWKEWQTPDGRPWVGELTPPCLGEVKAI